MKELTRIVKLHRHRVERAETALCEAQTRLLETENKLEQHRLQLLSYRETTSVLKAELDRRVLNGEVAASAVIEAELVLAWRKGIEDRLVDDVKVAEAEATAKRYEVKDAMELFSTQSRRLEKFVELNQHHRREADVMVLRSEEVELEEFRKRENWQFAE